MLGDDVEVFVGVMPDEPDSHDKVVSVYMSGSSPSMHTMKGMSTDYKAAIHLPNIQVIARDTTYPGASDLAWMVHDDLDGRTDWTLTGEDDSEIKIMGIQAMQLPFPSGKDSQDRKLFSHNYQLWIDNYA